MDSCNMTDHGLLEFLLLTLRRFGTSAQALGKRPREEKQDKNYVIEDEYDVQDLLYAILKPSIPDLDREDPISKVAGKSSRVDLCSKTLGLLIELKFVGGENCTGNIRDACATDIINYER